MKQHQAIHVWTCLFWITAALLFLAQVVFTLHSTGQLRYEEVAESIRNVFWLQHANIYDGTSSNVGWYGLLLFVYNIFGFSVHSAKIVRLFISLLSILALALLLKRHLGVKAAIIPLLTMGLSPTLLYFNTMQASFGIDLPYVIICLYLLDSLSRLKKYAFLLVEFMLWLLIMIAWMSYPSFVFYLPVLAILYLKKLAETQKWPEPVFHAAVAFTGFILPLFAAFLLISNSNLLIYDSVTQSGLFRGGGALVFSVQMFITNFGQLLSDMFIQAHSYHFDLYRTEFSGIYPAAAVIFVLLFSVWLAWKGKISKPLAGLIWISVIIEILIVNFTVDHSGRPGIRRSTSLLVFLYAFYVMGWSCLLTDVKTKALRMAGLLIFILIPVHHILAFPDNVSHAGDKSPYQFAQFATVAGNPQKTIDQLVAKTRTQELRLCCADRQGRPVQCRYAELYAAVAGTCLWNSLKCHAVYGYDDKTQRFIVLIPDLWLSYYWEH